MGAFIFAFILLGATFVLRYILKKKGITNPAPVKLADFGYALKLLALAPLLTAIIVSGFLITRRLKTTIQPVTTIFYRQNGQLRGVVVERVIAPALAVRKTRPRTTLPGGQELQFRLFDFSTMEEIAELYGRPIFRTELLPAYEMAYLGRSGQFIWIETDLQGLVAIDVRNLKVTDEAEIARRNPSIPLANAAIQKRGFDWNLERPFLSFAGLTFTVNPDFTLSKSTRPAPVDVFPNFDCDGRKLPAGYEFDSENRNGEVYFTLRQREKTGMRTLLEQTIPTEGTGGSCLDQDGSLFVLGVKGSTFPEYNITHLKL